MSIVSLFENATSTVPLKQITIASFFEQVKDGEWKELVEKIRETPDKEKRSALKKKLPAVTISGTFKQRNESSLLNHSGFICIDIDKKIDDRTLLEKDPYTYTLFDSASKQGIAIVVKIKTDKHRESFEFLQKYYMEKYNLDVDQLPKNVASLRFVSFDPDMKINFMSKVSGTYKPKKVIKPLPIILTGSQTMDVVNAVLEAQVDIAPDYERYRGLAFSLASEYMEDGLETFLSLCRLSNKFDHDNAVAIYQAACKRQTDERIVHKISISYFYSLAKKAGIEIPESDTEAVAIATIEKKSGKSTSQIAERLVSEKNISIASADHIASAVTDRAELTLKTLSTDPEKLIETLILFIQRVFPLRRNLITQKIEHTKSKEPIQDEDMNDIYLESRRAFNSPNVTKDLIQSIIFSKHTPSYNPLLNFIEKNKSITSTGHIDKLISSIHTTTPHANQFIRKWIIAIHAAIEWNPVRLMLTFTGPQYNGKTEFFRRLLPGELAPYYAESKLDRGKDDELLMCQKLIVMDDEMGGKSKQDEKRLKELTSKRYFTLRAPYRRDNMDYRRLAILCGTSNPTEIINDPTGNTRILPVKVDSIDYEVLNSVDRTALFMEAYHAYKAGEEWEISQEELVILNTLSEDFSSISFERELIYQFFAPGDTDKLTATEIKNEIEVNSKQQIKNMQRFGIELRKIFGDPKSVKRGFSVQKCYGVRKVEGEALSTSFFESADSEDIPF